MKKRMSPKTPYSSPSPSPSPFPISKLFFPHARVHEDGKDGCIDHKVRSGSTPSNGPQKATTDQAMPPMSRKGEVVSVSCDGCRPQYAWEGKISVVPLEYDSRGLNKAVPMSIPSPSHAFKTFISSLSRRSPVGASGSRTNRTVDEDYCKTAMDELSRKLIDTTRERDVALLEVSNLKHSMVELEKKLNRLEEYCYGLKSSLDEHRGSSNGSLFQMIHYQIPGKPMRKNNLVVNNSKSAEFFALAVSEAEECVKTLSRLLVLELPGAGSNAYETVSRLVRTYGMNFSNSTNRRSLIIYFEAILNAIFFEDFETVGFRKNGGSPMLNPIELCKANLASYKSLKRMTWEGVLEKGTRYYCGRFSGFCDRKMSDIIGRFGWRRAWSEALLEAFFKASKSMWLVHLLANSIHPGFLIFRVNKGAEFDPVYMVELGQDSEDQMSGSAVVQAMVSPGFYVQDSVLKCKVICQQQL